MWGQELSSLSGEMWKGTGEECASPKKPRMLVLEQHMGVELSVRQNWECLLWEAELEHE